MPDHLGLFRFVERPRRQAAAGRLGELLQGQGGAIGSVPLRNADFAPPRPASQGVAGHVVGDREQPRAETGLRLIAVPGFEHADEHVLRQVLRQLPVLHQVLQHRQQAILVARDKLLERGGIAVAYSQHQPHVGIVLLVMGRGRMGEGQSNRLHGVMQGQSLRKSMAIRGIGPATWGFALGRPP